MTTLHNTHTHIQMEAVFTSHQAPPHWYMRHNFSRTNSSSVSCSSLVSTYVVCERLSVMHEPAGVVEILVQILPEYPYSELGTEYSPPPWKLSKSPNLRVSETPPPNENCQRVQIWEFQNTPPNENCWRVQIWEFQNTPPNENCQRVQIREFQNTPPPQNENCQRVQIWEFQNTPSPKSEKLQISNFRIVLQSGRSYVETNL